MPSSSPGEGRTLSMHFNRSSQLLTLSIFCCFWCLKKAPSAALHYPPCPRGQAEMLCLDAVGKWNHQGCKVIASFPDLFNCRHLLKYRTPERPGLPSWCIVFRCLSTSSIRFFKLGHTKQIYWEWEQKWCTLGTLTIFLLNGLLTPERCSLEE